MIKSKKLKNNKKKLKFINPSLHDKLVNWVVMSGHPHKNKIEKEKKLNF